MYLNNFQSYTFGAIVFALVAFVACEKTSLANKFVVFDGKANLSVSENLWFGTDTLTGVYVSVTHILDSRCPEDVQCVHAGEANVKLLTVQQQDSVFIDLKITPADRLKPDTLAFTLNNRKYQAVLFDVKPFPNTSIDIGEKIATLTVLNKN